MPVMNRIVTMLDIASACGDACGLRATDPASETLLTGRATSGLCLIGRGRKVL